MPAVKDQGGCGSCWAFASNTALEGGLAVKTSSAPRHFSEQQLVSCSNYWNSGFSQDYNNHGCNGGWMSWAWDFQINEGIMEDSAYPYFSGSTGSEGTCDHDPA